ncbi:hypothetical protein WDU94_015547 [Cyamophila willieti]
MEWGVKENRIAVIALHKCNKSASEIFNLLQGLQISRKFVFRTIKRYNEMSSVDDRPRSGRPREVRKRSVIKAVRSRIRRNPLRKQNILSREMKIPVRTMSRIITQDLGLRAYRRRTAHRLTPTLRRIRATRSKKLLDRYANGGYKKILFTDEKIFNIEEKFNRQNDRVYARSSLEAAEKVPRGVKTKAANYQSDILEPVVKPLSETMFANQNWTFQQDSAPAHKAKTTQRWLAMNLPDFIAAEDWTSGSPDLNPLDYKLWNLLEEKACSKAHRNIESLKADLVQAAASIPLETVRAAIDDWPVRLKKCVKVRGGHFE